MAWIDALKGKLVAMDTSPMIYYLEEHQDYIGLLDPLFDMLDNGECLMVTSVITLLEGLVRPIRTNDSELARKWRDFLYTTGNFTTVDVSPQIAEQAAQLRASHTKLYTPDAVQIATAISEGAAAFLTNDKALKVVSGIKVLILDDFKIQPN